MIKEIAASEEAEKLADAPELDNGVGALLDTLDVYDDEEETTSTEEEPVVSEEAAEEKQEA